MKSSPARQSFGAGIRLAASPLTEPTPESCDRRRVRYSERISAIVEFSAYQQFVLVAGHRATRSKQFVADIPRHSRQPINQSVIARQPGYSLMLPRKLCTATLSSSSGRGVVNVENLAANIIEVTIKRIVH